MSSQIESDEAFARRLQAQEMGMQGLEQTPLMLDRLVSSSRLFEAMSLITVD